MKSDLQGEPAMIRGHCCGQPRAPGGGRWRAMIVSGRRRVAVGYRGWRLEREVDKSGGRQSRQQSRTKVMGIGAARYLIFVLITFMPGALGTASENQ